MNRILTPAGYVDIADIQIGDSVCAYDPETGLPIINIVISKNWINKSDFLASNVHLSPSFDFYVINDTWKVFQDQSIWCRHISGEIRVVHATDLIVGDALFDDKDQPVVIATIDKVAGDGWWRFDISGDHSYVVDGLTLHNASRFWVGGGSANTWAATANTNWAASSGGANNQTVPGTSDVAVFDGGSGTSNSVIGANITVQGLECDGSTLGTGTYGGTLTHNTSVTLTLNTGAANTFRLTAGMTYTPASTTSLVTVTHTSGTAGIKCAGKSLFAFTMNGAGGTTQPVDTLQVNAGTNAALTITAGTLDCNTNTAAITTCLYQDLGTATRAVSWGGTVTVGGAATTTTSVMNWASLTGMTFTKNSAGVVVLPPSTPHAGYTFSLPLSTTINALTLNAASTPYVLSITPTGFTGSTLTIGAGVNVLYPSTQTNTWTSVVGNGTPLLPNSIITSGAVIAAISASSTGSLNWCAVGNATFSGGAAWTAKNSLSTGLNSGITITPPGWGPNTESIPQRAFKAGATSQSIDIFIQDGTSLSGSGLTGLVYNSSGLTAYYRKGQTGTATAITLATQTVGGAYSSGGFVQIDSTNMPGMYRFDIPDTVLASAGGATIYFQGASNMVPCVVELEIVAYDPTNATTLGLTNLDAAISTRLATTSISLSSGAVTVGTNNDKSGYALTQTFPTNFSALGITAGGHISTVDALTTYTGNTPQTGDVFANLPLGFSTITIASGRVSTTSNIQKNTAKAGFMFVMTDATTHAPVSGLTVAATRSIDGAAFASCTNAVSGVSNGTYKIDLSAADTNGDHIMLRFTSAGADDLNIEIVTQP